MTMPGVFGYGALSQAGNKGRQSAAPLSDDRLIEGIARGMARFRSHGEQRLL